MTPRVPASIALLVLALLGATASATAGSRGAAWDGCTPKPGDYRFLAGDGTRLVGHRFGTGKIAIVLAHQSDGTLCQWVPYARRLARLGYSAFAFDFRNVGQSQVRHYPANRRWAGDVAAAAKLVRRLGARKVFLVGASFGGSAVLAAAANVRPQVDGVVSVSGAADLVNAVVAVKSLKAPVLLMAGELDRDFAADVPRLYEAASSTDKTMKVFPGRGEHGVQLVAASAEARTLIEGFIRTH